MLDSKEAHPALFEKGFVFDYPNVEASLEKILLSVFPIKDAPQEEHNQAPKRGRVFWRMDGFSIKRLAEQIM